MKSNTIYPDSYDKKRVSEQNTLKQLMRKNFGNENVVNAFYNLLQEDASIQGFKDWLQGKLDELNKDDKRVYDMPTDYRAFMLEDLLTELGVEF